MLYGSWPVLQAADQMRSLRGWPRRSRASITSGSSLNCSASNGAPSRKKIVSCVVIASTTCCCSAGSVP